MENAIMADPTEAPLDPMPAFSAPHGRPRPGGGLRLAAGFALTVTLMLAAAYLSYREVDAVLAAHRAEDAAEDALVNLERAAPEKSVERRLQRAERAAALRRTADEESGKLDRAARSLRLVAAFARVVGAVVVLLAFLAMRRFIAQRDGSEAALVEARDAALRDAAARRRAQEEAWRLSGRLKSVLDQMDSGVILIEPDGTLSLFNHAAERIHGSWKSEIERAMRDGFFKAMRPDGTPLPPEEEPAARALKGESVRDARVLIRTPYRPAGCLLSVSAAPMRGPEGLITGALLVFRENA